MKAKKKLFEEMDNWPTYYPSSMTGLEIATRDGCSLGYETERSEMERWTGTAGRNVQRSADVSGNARPFL